MKKNLFNIVIIVIMTTGLSALDVRVETGYMMPENIFLKDSKSLGLVIADYTNKKGKGLSYGYNIGVYTSDLKTDRGAYMNLNAEVVWKLNKGYEPYITGGGVYQSLPGIDYGYGYGYGAGIRYSSCKGFQIGMELIRQEMTLKSGRDEIVIYKKTEYINHNVNIYVGYRF